MQDFIARHPGYAHSQLLEKAVIPTDFIDEFQYVLDWFGLSSNPNLPWSLDFLRKFDVHWEWKRLADNPGLPHTPEILNLFKRNVIEVKTRGATDGAIPPPLDFSTDDVVEMLRAHYETESNIYELKPKGQWTAFWGFTAKFLNAPEQLVDPVSFSPAMEGKLQVRIEREGEYDIPPGFPIGDFLGITEALKPYKIDDGFICSPRLKELLGLFNLAPHTWIPCELLTPDRAAEKGWLLCFHPISREALEPVTDYANTEYSVKVANSIWSDDLEQAEVVHTYPVGSIQSREDVIRVDNEWEKKYPDKFTLIDPLKARYVFDYDLFARGYASLYASGELLTALARAGMWKSAGTGVASLPDKPVVLQIKDPAEHQKRLQNALKKVTDQYGDRPMQLDSWHTVEWRKKQSKKWSRIDRLEAKRDRLAESQGDLAKLRSNPNKPDLLAQLTAASKRLGCTFPEEFIGFVSWLQDLNVETETVKDLPEASILLGGYGEAYYNVVDLRTEIDQKTAELREVSGLPSLIALATYVFEDGEELGIIGFDPASMNVRKWSHEDEVMRDEDEFGWKNFIGDIDRYKAISEKENIYGAIFPAWFKHGLAKEVLKNEFLGYKLFPLEEIHNLEYNRSTQYSVPETVKAMCIGEHVDSDLDDFLIFLLEEDSDFNLEPAAITISGHDYTLSDEWIGADGLLIE